MFGKVVFAFIAFFVVASEAQGCSPALGLPDGSFTCPSTLTLTGTQCCPNTPLTDDNTPPTDDNTPSTDDNIPSTGSCSPALALPDGSFTCPSTLTLSGTQCCPSTPSTGSCSPALALPDGSYVCPSTLTLTGTQCCSPTSSTTNSNCVDLLNPRTGVSDCPSRAHLCNNETYYTLMTQQCPRTCNRCSSTSSSSTGTTGCVDLTNPATGVSDCPSRSQLCNVTVYTSLMRVQCPRTCGFCTSG